MNATEAKFLLQAYRPNGSDASDPRFAEALALVQRDPALRAWFERQRAHDSAVSAQLNSLPPPPRLRDAILAGARASQPRRMRWITPTWLAAAAAVVLLLSFTVRGRFAPNSAPTAQEFAAFALGELEHQHNAHLGEPPGLAEVQAQLAQTTTPLPERLALNFDELKQKRCRTARFAGREVFEICFERDGRWYHLYAARVKDFAPGPADPRALLIAKGTFAATAWKNAQHLYALVGDAGADDLKRLL